MKRLAYFKVKPLSLAVLTLPIFVSQAHAEDDTSTQTLAPVQVTAERQLKQAPGVSIITREDVEKTPVANDLSEIIRTQPGVNLTGNSASGYRGNQRQIDLRGMGPENTLILIDGKPVSSRESVKYGRSGDRDTRGDTNWVPAEEVDSVEVIRGPAAARYGSGAAGGVVNIITRGISKETHASVTTYFNKPQHDDEGGTSRVNANVSGPLSETLGYRVYANYNKTGADSPDINVDNTASGATTAAGREGVKNKDVNVLMRWKPASPQTVDFNYAFSRQANIYAGDTQTAASATSSTSSSSATNGVASTYLGRTTNVMLRDNFSLEHRGDWDALSTRSYIQYERTRNSRLDQGAAGKVDGNIDSTNWSTASLNAYSVHTEASRTIQQGVPQVLTTGVEWKHENLKDPGTYLNQASNSSLVTAGYYPSSVQTTNSVSTGSLFSEDNLILSDNWSLTPGVRFDDMNRYGNNWSPALNTTYALTQNWTLKGGVARAFKAPNLYQSNPSYLYVSGDYCSGGTGCYILGNDNLKPETSVNKELGLAWKNNAWNGGITWYRNDYRNKIVTGTNPIGSISYRGNTYKVYRWENVDNAIVEGFEGNLAVPLAKTIKLNNNLTYMRRNEDNAGQPLSVIPKFTINSSLDWQINEKLNTMLTGTFYGEQVPRTSNYGTGADLTDSATDKLSPYNIWNTSVGYKFNNRFSMRAGIENLFDKRIYREGSGQTAGAATYNQTGRAYFVSMTASL